MTELYVGKVDEFEDRGKKVVTDGTHEVGVICLDGEFYAYSNYCPHQGGPVCQGKIINRVVEELNEDRTLKGLAFSKEDIHIVCPWHGMEFNIKSGEFQGDSTIKLQSYDLTVRDGEIYVEI